MSDAYDIDGVTVTPGAGGWYVLTGKGIEGDGEKVQGKENADKRASEIAKGNTAPEGHIPPQGDLNVNPTDLQGGAGGDIIQPGDTRSAAERSQERAAGLPEPTPPAATPPVQGEVQDPEAVAKAAAEANPDKERADAAEAANKQLQSSLQTMEERFAKLEKLMGGISTVVATEPDTTGQVPGDIPREYAGQMDPKVKKALKAQGIEVVTIVLEENESIPPTGLFIGHNGRGYMIKPGEEVDVPDFLISVLDDAVMSAPIVDSQNQKVLGYRDRSKYPYRRVTSKG